MYLVQGVRLKAILLNSRVLRTDTRFKVPSMKLTRYMAWKLSQLFIYATTRHEKDGENW